MTRARGGFTLVEIVVVLAIMAVVTATVVPAMLRTVATDPVAASADQVAQVLRAARNAALERASPVTVTIIPASNAYEAESDSDGTPSIIAQGVLALAQDARMSSDRPRVHFVFGRGGVADPDSVAIIGQEGSLMVSVDRWTGEVHVRATGR